MSDAAALPDLESDRDSSASAARPRRSLAQVSSWSHAWSGLSITERNWIVSLLLAVGAAVAFRLIELLEIAFGRPSEARFVIGAVETSTRYIGLGHISLGTFLLLISRRARSARSLAWLAGLTLLAVGLCSGYSVLRIASPGVAFILFYLYFLSHDARDQVMFHALLRRDGDGKCDTVSAPAEDLHVIPIAVWGIAVVTTTTLLVTMLILGLAPKSWRFEELTQQPVIIQALLVLLPAALLASWMTRTQTRLARTYPGGIRGLVRSNLPALRVSIGGILVFALGVLVTQRPHLIVSFHVTSWYIFTFYMLRTEPAPPAVAAADFRSWKWWRGTPTGFTSLHLAIIGLFMVLGVFRAYVSGNDSANRFLFAMTDFEAFPLWTITHITLSWLPR